MRYNIIDKPNHRTSHTVTTIRGGGVVIPIAFLLFYLTRQFGFSDSLNFHENDLSSSNYLLFGIGILLICIISFIDDIMDLSTRIRIVFHFIAVTFLLLFLDVFMNLPWWAIVMSYVLIIGILNAYNFMDGINGITGLYSVVLFATLLYVNLNVIAFTETDFILYPLIASLVFLFYNFRSKAKCFLGDVGSMGLAFWIMGLLGLLLIKSQDIKWMLLLAVYGVEVILTILQRIQLRENIFEAHRRHLYQILANERKISHRVVSSIYAGVQLLINLIVVFFNHLPVLVLFVLILLPLSLLYLYIKTHRANHIALL